MLTFTTPQLRKLVKDADPSNPAVAAVDNIDFLEFNQLEQSVKEDVEYLKTNPLVLKESVVTGWVYDVGTGKVCRFIMCISLLQPVLHAILATDSTDRIRADRFQLKKCPELTRIYCVCHCELHSVIEVDFNYSCHVV